MRPASVLPLAFVGILIAAEPMFALGRPPYVGSRPAPGSFPLVVRGEAAPIHTDPADWPGVLRATRDLQADIHRVTGITPDRRSSVDPPSGNAVIVGTLGRSALVDRLAREKKIDIAAIVGKWESFVVQTVTAPLPGVSAALVIAGSDKRGTIYGIYDLSEQIGVSPWYWWADVAPDRKPALFVRQGRYEQGEPSVRYRGIFLNDERPDLDFWVRKTYGERAIPGEPGTTAANFNGAFYARIFEVILRLKGNYLWPAMWNNAFADDDPGNPRLADEYGIVMGSTHQEPMLRAQKEWDWYPGRQHGNWNYAAHPDVLEAFWREGVRQRKDFESIITIGLRGENDTAMVHGQAESMTLLERIVDVQRKILAEEINPDVTKVPQLWCLYKEVQDYYEAGLRVPDDVTLLWADDNWGNIRRLPSPAERPRSGGAGVYYHFDYHGGPRSYQWINTNPLPKIWDQMAMAKQYGADRIWIVNAGHFKGYELPTEYFLDLAWDTKRWTHDNINEYMQLWATREFGEQHAGATAEILARTTRFNGRRKPELLEPGTYSLVNDHEWERVVEDFRAIVSRADRIHRVLPPHKRDAFYSLVLFPAKAAAQVNEMYFAAARNALYASQGRASTNDMAQRTRELFEADRTLMAYFNKVFAGGKWDHFMDQPHIGYTSWRDPPRDSLDAIPLKEIEVPQAGSLGVAVEGSPAAWPGAPGDPELPPFDALNRQQRDIDVFNRGRAPVRFAAGASAPWILLSSRSGLLREDTRIRVRIDWAAAPAGTSRGAVTITGGGSRVVVTVTAFKPEEVTRRSLRGFAETDGVVSIEAEHYTRRIDRGERRWIRVEGYGHTRSGMRSTSPTGAEAATPGSDAARLEYGLHLFTPGALDVRLTVAPTLNVMPDRGLRVAVSFDDQPPAVVTLVPPGYRAQNGNKDWEESVRNNARVTRTSHVVKRSGAHTLKVRAIDPGVVLQKIVIHTTASKDRASYLGPPESYSRD